MFEDFFHKTFYYNTISDWLFAFLIILASILVAKLFYWLSGNVLKKIAKRTKTKLDDIVIDMLEEPLVFFIIIIGVWFSLHDILNFPENVNIWIGRVYYILIIFNIAWLLVRTIDALLEHYIAPLAKKTETNIDDVLLPIFRSSFRVIIWSLAIIIGLNNAGYNVGAVLTGLGIGGLAFALAAKDTISNIFGGIIVMTNRPFIVGDVIEYNETWAKVEAVGIRITKLSHFDYDFPICVPNSYFLTNSVMNISAREGFLYFLDFNISQYTPPAKLKKAFELLVEITQDNKRVKFKDVRLIGFDNYALNLRLYIDVLEFKERHIARTELRVEIHRLFYENDIYFAEYVYGQPQYKYPEEKVPAKKFMIDDFLQEIKKAKSI